MKGLLAGASGIEQVPEHGRQNGGQTSGPSARVVVWTFNCSHFATSAQVQYLLRFDEY